jgi:cell division septal protein FtsQ
MNTRNPAFDRTGEAGGFLRRRGNMMVRRKRRLQFLSRGLTRMAILVVLALVAAWGMQRAYGWLITTESLLVTKLEVVGTEYADATSVRSLASRAMQRNMLALDLDGIVEDVRRHPWVASAVVQRRLPDTLVIEVTERTPCALAVMHGNILMLDTRGMAIDRYGPRFAQWSLPVFRGLDDLETDMGYAQSHRAAVQVEVLRQQYPDFFARLTEVDLSNSSYTTLSFEGGDEHVRVLPGDWTRNLDEYRALRKKMFQQHERIRHVDLRWQGRVVAKPINEDAG